MTVNMGMLLLCCLAMGIPTVYDTTTQVWAACALRTPNPAAFLYLCAFYTPARWTTSRLGPGDDTTEPVGAGRSLAALLGRFLSMYLCEHPATPHQPPRRAIKHSRQHVFHHARLQTTNAASAGLQGAEEDQLMSDSPTTDTDIGVSRSAAFILLAMYIQYLFFQLYTHPELFAEEDSDDEVRARAHTWQVLACCRPRPARLQSVTCFSTLARMARRRWPRRPTGSGRPTRRPSSASRSRR